MNGAPADLDALSVTEIRAALARGEFSVAELTQWHLDRIDRFDGAINSVIECNPDALEIARELDSALRSGAPPGALCGVPILLKDNIETGDRMMTTAGSIALEGHFAPRDAELVARLRQAGAVILGKCNLAEWANFRSLHSTRGWSSRGGLTRNPYAQDRTAGGSSSGSAAAAAAAFCVAAVGTETDGSVVSPAALNSLVGIKPTLGLVSRRGLIPISPVQDTAGVMARRVADAAAVLSAIAGASADDAATAEADAHRADYAAALDAATLKGARIGVARSLSLFHPAMQAVLDEAVHALNDAGAATLDVEALPVAAIRQTEYEALVTEYGHALDAYLAALPPDMPVHSVKELVAFNRAHQETVMPHFGQDLLERALEAVPLEDETYRGLRAECARLAREQGLQRLLQQHRLDALAVISTAPPWAIDLVSGDGPRYTSAYLAAIPGYPNVTVPAGYVHGLPVGLSFMGGPWQEVKLLRIAHAFECATAIRRPPPLADAAAREPGGPLQMPRSEEVA
jgi:amidase